MQQNTSIKTILRLIGTWVMMTFVIGSVSAWFLHQLQSVTDNRLQHNWLIYFLPIAGFIITWIYQTLGSELEAGNNLVIQRIIGKKKNNLPLLIAPLIYVSTLLSHLFGASVGREGTAIQYGAGIADWFQKQFSIPRKYHRILLQSAVAAGFASVFATPLTGILFAIEWTPRKFKWKQLPIVFASAFGAYACAQIWNPPHTHYIHTHDIDWSWSLIGGLLLAALLFGLVARLFSSSISLLKKGLQKILPYAPLRTFVGGLAIVALYLIIQDNRYLGLGIPTIQDAFVSKAMIYVFALKILFTVISIASGFKGGEVTPLFFIGATLGSTLAFFLPIETSLLAAMGFVAVFAGATNTPFTCAIMAGELFGWETLIISLPVCYLSFLVSGKTSIYSEQIPLLRKLF